MTDSSIKYTGGQRLYATQGYPSPFGGWGYYARRTVTNLACKPLGAGSFRCSYHFLKVFQVMPDSIWGTLMVAQLSPTEADYRYTVLRKGAGWSIPELDRENAQRNTDAATSRDDFAAENDRRQQWKYDQEERQRRFDECVSGTRS